MLRGLTTVTFFADDLAAARDWYTDLLGLEPYFERRSTDGPPTSSSASATTRPSWASSTAASPRRAGRRRPATP